MAHDSTSLAGSTLTDTARPREEGPDASDACTVVVALRDSPGALARIAATLGSTPVLALAYVVTGPRRALAEIRLPRAHVVRARNKLSRMVDTTYVSDPGPTPTRTL
ncbi:hypothetical protein ACFVU3_05995 [Streptomyces sp. NPDC058052]|uniref:hypothetical protein n=1 Tax=Streptomyces sp. NPDC058052 TaxID=3346316 RepID=UPI0036E20427